MVWFDLLAAWSKTMKRLLDPQFRTADPLQLMVSTSIQLNWSMRPLSFPFQSRTHLISGTAVLDHFLKCSITRKAGQQVYYSTHQWFLSDRAIYLVLFNLTAEKQQPEIEYVAVMLVQGDHLRFWLNCIRLRAKDSVVVLVGTHLDQTRVLDTAKYLVLLLFFANTVETY